MQFSVIPGRMEPRNQPPGVTGAGSYAPSPWRCTQVQQGSGFLQELKATIQLNQLECRAGTITWGHQQNKVQRCFPSGISGASQPTVSFARKTQCSERGGEPHKWLVQLAEGATWTHQSPLPSDRTCPAGSSRLCPSCPWWDGAVSLNLGRR